MEWLQELKTSKCSLAQVRSFLKGNKGLLQILKKCVKDAKELYPDAELVLELDTTWQNSLELGLLIKDDTDSDDIMERFFDLEGRNPEAFAGDYMGIFYVDIYGLHTLRGEDI